MDELLSTFPELSRLAYLAFYKLSNIDSSNVQPKHWIKIAEKIYENYEKYDGFIVTHGTDTMTYTASALSFALRALNKPVVLTGAMKAPREEGSDAKDNLFNSIKVASSNLNEVCICFDNQVYRGNRAKKVRNEATKITNEDLKTYASINFPLLGKIRKGKLVLNENVKKPSNNGTLALHTDIASAVLSVKLFPGFNSKVLGTLSKDIHGVVIEAFGPGNAPFIESDILDTLKKLVSSGVAVVVATQCPFGEVDMNMYEVGRKLEEVGVISAKDMTSECTIVKLMFALGGSKNPWEVRNFMNSDIGGEIRA